MPRWPEAPLTEDRRLFVLRKLLRRGHITPAEAAALIGVTRQYMYRLTRDLQPVQRRARYVKQLWREALDMEDA